MLKRAGRAAARRLGPSAACWLARSWRVEVVGTDESATVVASGRPYVLICWHEALLPVMWHHRRRGISALVSQARDGGYLADFAAGLGYGLIRGSSTRHGHRALMGAIRALRRGTPVGITPDGPVGPARVLKPGALTAAQKTRALILPVHADARPRWRARSWDRFLVPPLFSRVRVAYGRAFEVGAGSSALQAAIGRCTTELDNAARMAAWLDGVATPTG